MNDRARRTATAERPKILCDFLRPKRREASRRLGPSRLLSGATRSRPNASHQRTPYATESRTYDDVRAQFKSLIFFFPDRSSLSLSLCGAMTIHVCECRGGVRCTRPTAVESLISLMKTRSRRRSQTVKSDPRKK